MSSVTITFSEEGEGTGFREVILTREKEELNIQDMLYFFAEASRAAGYEMVHRVGYSTDKGQTFWSEF